MDENAANRGRLGSYPQTRQPPTTRGVFMDMKLISILAVAGTAAFALPALAEDTPPTGTPSAEQQCRTERTQMGTTTFRQTYGTNANRSNAFGKCVSKRASATETATEQAHTNASQTCRAEQTADAAAFSAKYGTNGNDRNAFGKCVSQHAKAETTAEVKQDVSNDVSASKACRTERSADKDAFATKYGTERSHRRNAFGRCVSQTAKAMEHEQDSDQQESGTS
jgi:hypothetical protein